MTDKLVGPNPANPNQNVPNLLRLAIIKDFQLQLQDGWPQAVPTVRSTVSGQPCLDMSVSVLQLALTGCSVFAHITVTMAAQPQHAGSCAGQVQCQKLCDICIAGPLGLLRQLAPEVGTCAYHCGEAGILNLSLDCP